ncbi:MAG: glucose 1-dehydrogenase [Rhodospirillaceae bacterium]|jgi:NAD(P)-dependent dehydrogenase (short-subunit alcohol dehydrogenase family)|nr:glucose 1-dehydrogenase [Rhodospirillaceae bacterium]MBT5457797.1 glucose 1-dehydrogenase [Rhodospirillaceae bacterium]
MSGLFRLDGKCAIVTGGSGSLGCHFAEVLANAGASVALAARRVEKMEKVSAEINAAGGKSTAIPLDVTDAVSIAAAFTIAEERLGPVTVLVNNAGVVVSKPLLEQNEADWDKVLDVNLKGAWLVAQEAARRMAAAGGGNIINVASILGLRSIGSVPAYGASKAGLIHLTKAMALELAPQGVRVNALAPGYIETDLNRDFFSSEAGLALVARIPQRRLGQVEDLDGSLLLLASDASRYMTGAVIAVDGGHLVSSL